MMPKALTIYFIILGCHLCSGVSITKNNEIPHQKTPDFVKYNELVSNDSGGRILFSTDDFFAVAENLLKDDDPVKNDSYTEYGKWMDGWETRRRRTAGHDWAIIALARPSIIEGVLLDTTFFTGNYAPRFSIQAARLSPKDESLFPKRNSQMGSSASKKDLKEMALLKTEEWTTLVPIKSQAGNSNENYVSIYSDEKWTHLRLNLFPDGGIARLRVYGYAQPNWSTVKSDNLIDLVSNTNGGFCVEFSNSQYSSPKNLIKPGRGVNMGDGWETARKPNRPPVLEDDENGMFQPYGSEWAMFKLGHVGEVSSIQIDTTHFKGNCPYNIKVEGALVSSGKNIKNAAWKSLLPTKKLVPDKEQEFKLNEIFKSGLINYIKITIAPDGGFSRIRIWGYIRNNNQ